ncbi:hypothetical protein ACQ33O_09675 [Ferruginibacter sp. SUN002]|uniref:hypothetical protein n=1 Tax=Ferruginibacter sp. SUN002 TaxID=2937789 RepID=UPI003D360C23
MKKNHSLYTICSFLLVAVVIIGISCKKRDVGELQPTIFPTTAEVFIDDFTSDLAYSAFGGSDVKAFQVDKDVAYNGTNASMRFAVPDANSPQGSYAGGVFYSKTGRNLSGYNVLSFYIKASQPATIEICGLGNDLGQSKYQVSKSGVAVNTNWKKVYIPIPDASKLTQEKGLFYYSTGPENGKGYTFWIDEVKFEKLETIAYSAATILNGVDKEQISAIGIASALSGFSASYNLPDGINETINISPYYLQFLSSDPSVATVNETGVVNTTGGGTSKITAMLGTLTAKGSLTIKSSGVYVGAPLPTKAATDVISIFSDAYTNVKVDYYNGYWAPYQTTLSADFEIGGDHVLNYSNFNFVGTQISSPSIDVSSKSFLHLDIFIPGTLTPGANFKVKVLDFGADGVAGGSDDVSGEVSFTAPTLVGNGWTSLDIPFTSLPTLTTKGHIGQIIYEGANISNFFADNIYFWSNPATPLTAAPTPTTPAANVISIFSDAYTNVAGTDFNPNWGQVTAVSQLPIAGNNTLKYAGLNYQGTQFGSNQNLSAYGSLHIDYYATNSTSLKLSLISPGKETPYTLNVPTSGSWTSADIPLSAFASIVDLTNVIQIKIEGNGDVFIDNIYFWKFPATPPTAAPTPTRDAAKVISIFSGAYTNVAGTDFNPNWGQATAVSQLSIAGNNTLKYAGLNYQGTQFGSNQNVSTYDVFHIDYYTANSTSLKLFLISPGKETPYTLNVPTGGVWTSVDIPLSAFSSVVDLTNVFQIKIEGNGDIYIDNLYFYKSGSGGGGGAFDITKTIDFEPAGFGAGWTWNVFENGSNPPLAFVANPNASGINTSSQVAKFSARQAGQPYAGVEVAHGQMGITWNLSATNSKIRIMVYKTKISDVGIKLANTTGGAQSEIKVANTLVNTWEELTFDFSSRIGNGLDGSTNIDQIIVFPDFVARGADDVIYFDNIRFGN